MNRAKGSRELRFFSAQQETCSKWLLPLVFPRFSGTFVPGQRSYQEDSTADPQRFQALVEAHYESLYRFAMSLTRSENEARDLVQDTFVTWARKGHQLADPSKAKAWLFTTLHRAFLESRRRIVRFPQVELATAETELPHMEADAMTQSDAATILAMLDQVDEQFKAAVALFYLEDFSYEEISQLLDVPLGTVKSRIARGIRQLKELALSEPGARMGREVP